jgi:hypothetical protein
MVEERVLLAQGISRLLWERDNAWLHGSSPGGCRKPGFQFRYQTKGFVEIGHIAKSPRPGERVSCSAWAICLG